jgi:hypothetical protein
MKAFNSNTRKLNRVVPKTDINNIVGASLIEKLVNDAQLQGETYSGSFASVEDYNYESSFDSRTKKTFNTKNRTNPNQSKVKRSEKDLVLGFRNDIMDITANWVFRQPDFIEVLDDTRIRLIFNNVYLQGATTITSSNFDVYVNGVRTPSYLSIEQSEIGVNLIINEFIGIDSTNKDKVSIYVKGKFEQLILATEDNITLLTENDEEIIL